MLNTNVWARHSVEKNVDFMQNMSCSLPSPEAIHAARFMQRIHAEYRHASGVMRHAVYPDPEFSNILIRI